ncbi:hypothetical protein CPB83DRAFT_896833 [Crepidotus variabilis]|uniref:Gustatory receptor n=1 Tax=Crepidotus variabilis TaxID=179855 RepID=A0A9P6EAV2_9AGAR|nr:hypothetical protein CPB83DRAFT_896833 [Crepidotus variabilis]
MTCFSHTKPLVITTLLLSLSRVYAKKGGSAGHSTSGSSDISLTLDLSSVNAATFSFYIIFSFFTLLQLFSCYKLRRPYSPEENFPRRSPFRWILAILILCLLTSYGLGATVIAHDKFDGPRWRSSFYGSQLSPAVYGMAVIMRDLVDIFIYLGLMVLIQHRYKTLSHSKESGAPRMNSLLWIVPFVLMGLMLATSIIFVILLCVLIGNPAVDEVMLGVLQGFSHLRLILYLLLTISFIVACTTLWRHVLNNSPPEHHKFDLDVLAPIQKSLCVVLAIRAMYELAIYIPQFVDPALDIDIVDLTGILVEGIVYLVVISTALSIGKTHKEVVQQTKHLDTKVHN